MYHMHTISKPLDGPEMLMATSADDATKDSTFRKIYTRDRRGAPMADRLKVGQILWFSFTDMYCIPALRIIGPSKKEGFDSL